MDIAAVEVIYRLLPGFLAAWLFYGLTAHPRRELFERVVQALIFTGIIQVVTTCFGWFCLLLGKIYAIARPLLSR